MPKEGAPATPSRRELLAFVNGEPDRVGVSLINSNRQSLASAGCQAAGSGVHIAYSAVCTLAVPDAAPMAGLRLRLSVKERFKTVPTDYTLLLP